MDPVIINIGRDFDERVGLIEAQPVGAHLPDAIVLSKDNCAPGPVDLGRRAGEIRFSIDDV